MKAFYLTKPTSNAYMTAGGDIAVCIDWTAKDVQRGARTVSGFECTEIQVRSTMLTRDNVIEEFVREKYSQSEEFALINAYNASISNIKKDDAKEQEYLSFLSWRESMKIQVKAAIDAYTATVEPEPETTQTTE